jgi:hypothetical protein
MFDRYNITDNRDTDKAITNREQVSGIGHDSLTLTIPKASGKRSGVV